MQLSNPLRCKYVRLLIGKPIQKFRNELTPGIKGGRKPGSYQWYEIQDNIAYWQEFERPKIILGRFMNKATFSFDTNKYYHNDALYMISGINEFIVAILNSLVSWYVLSQICTDLQNGYLQAFRENLFQIPITIATPAEQTELENLVQRILENPNAANVTDLEAENNERVYRLYGLTRDEIAVIEGAEEIK